jgi:hypothetical protein
MNQDTRSLHHQYCMPLVCQLCWLPWTCLDLLVVSRKLQFYLDFRFVGVPHVYHMNGTNSFMRASLPRRLHLRYDVWTAARILFGHVSMP